MACEDREVLFIDQRTRTDWCDCVLLDTIVCVRENVSVNGSELLAGCKNSGFLIHKICMYEHQSVADTWHVNHFNFSE